MNKSSLHLFFVCLLFSFAYAENFCADWESYKDKKCIKLINKSNLQSFDEAEKTCASNENSKLISINNQDEQSFLEIYLFKKVAVVDNVWLNAKSDSSHVFHWSDGRLLTFTNWAPSNPKVNSTTEICLQMDSDALVRGKWANEPCAKKNLVVCERKQGWNLEKIQSLIEKLQETNEKQQQEIESLKANPVPLGFIYVQLPNQKSPQEIWPLTRWTDDSVQYDSNFFRISGSKAAPFGRVQEEFAPYIDEIKMDECKGTHCFNANTDWNLWSVKTLHTGGWSPHVMSASLERGTGEWYKGLMQFHTAGGEVRPKNMAVKVWKRSA